MLRMKRDISDLLFDHLDFFQEFDEVKVYYDNGQDIVKQALDQTIGFVLSKGVVERRKTSMTDYRLEQVADYLCTIELAAVKYGAGEAGETYNKFFGKFGPLRRTGSSKRVERGLIRHPKAPSRSPNSSSRTQPLASRKPPSATRLARSYDHTRNYSWFSDSFDYGRNHAASGASLAWMPLHVAGRRRRGQRCRLVAGT